MGVGGALTGLAIGAAVYQFGPAIESPLPAPALQDDDAIELGLASDAPRVQSATLPVLPRGVPSAPALPVAMRGIGAEGSVGSRAASADESIAGFDGDSDNDVPPDPRRGDAAVAGGPPGREQSSRLDEAFAPRRRA